MEGLNSWHAHGGFKRAWAGVKSDCLTSRVFLLNLRFWSIVELFQKIVPEVRLGSSSISRRASSELLDPGLLIEILWHVHLNLLVDWLVWLLEGLLEVGVLELESHLLASVWHVADEEDLGELEAVISVELEVVEGVSWFVFWELSSKGFEGGVLLSLGNERDVAGAIINLSQQILGFVLGELLESSRDLWSDSAGCG